MKISFEDYNIPDVFKFIRESANITQLELAKKMHKSVQWVKAVERGTINIKSFLLFINSNSYFMF